VWVRLPEPLDAGELLPRAQKEGVAYLPAATSRYPARAGRIAIEFCGPHSGQIRSGLSILDELFRARSKRLRSFEPASAMVYRAARRRERYFTEVEMFDFSSEQFRLKVGLAEMLQGWRHYGRHHAEQAKIAEDAGASAVMALERVPADIRKEGGVARMANIGIMEAIMRTVHIPVMAKARIGHFHGSAHSGGAGRGLHRRERSAHPPTKSTTSPKAISRFRSCAAPAKPG